MLRICIPGSDSIPEIRWSRCIIIDEIQGKIISIKKSRVYLGIDNTVENAVELDINCHHGLTAHDIEIVNMRRVFEILVFDSLTNKITNYYFLCISYLSVM